MKTEDNLSQRRRAAVALRISAALRLCASILLLAVPTLGVQAQRATVSGSVTDETGARISAARVALVDPAGAEVDATTDEQGRFTLRNVAPGTYTVRVTAEGFEEYASDPMPIARGAAPIAITLTVAGVTETVTVAADQGVAIEPDRNADALVLKEKDLEALPDDPDELAQALQEMAGPAAGPGGGPFYVDGFSGGRLPPKASIREVRINSNPFSAEYDRIGFGRIEIFTKPGSDRFRGSVFGSFTDEALNARNPFAPTRPSEQDRRYGGNVGGPLGKKASFFFDFERRESDDNATVNAVVLDPTFTPVPFATTLLVPQRRTTFAPRFDFQTSENNTLIVRYEFENDVRAGQGVGNFALPSAEVESRSRENELTITNTYIINPSMVAETRLRLERERNETAAVDLSGLPRIVVSDAFVDRSSTGVVESLERRIELQQNFSLIRGNHTVRTGVRVRGVKLETSSTSNFFGTFTFAGAGDLTSIEQYQNVLLGTGGARPSQFTLSTGDPFASVTQFDVGAFVQDDWRVRPHFTLSFGVRYEDQTNAGDELNFAPRVGFAYAFNTPDGRPATVIRGGFGVFFEQINEGLTLDEVRFDGTRQRQYFVPNPSFFPVVPTEAELDAFALPVSTQRLDAFQTPYTIQGSVSVERQLPWEVTANVTYLWGRGVHLLRTRNINAPDPATGLRPLGDAAGNVFAVESTGTSRRHQMRIGFNKRAGWVSFFGNYGLGSVRSDTDGAGTQPADPYDLSEEFGRSREDSRHFFFIGSSIQGPWGLQFSPHVFFRSGTPYNITLGRDLNGDAVFTDRPGLADADTIDAVATPIGFVDPTPGPDAVLVERNAAQGPSFSRVNLAVTKNFGFGGSARDGAGGGAGAMPGDRPRGGGPGGGGGGPRMGGPGGHGGPGGFGGGQANDARYNLSVSVRASNLLNHPSFFNPSGVLTSPSFGIPTSAAPGRRVELQMRFSFLENQPQGALGSQTRTGYPVCDLCAPCGSSLFFNQNSGWIARDAQRSDRRRRGRPRRDAALRRERARGTTPRAVRDRARQRDGLASDRPRDGAPARAPRPALRRDRGARRLHDLLDVFSGDDQARRDGPLVVGRGERRRLGRCRLCRRRARRSTRTVTRSAQSQPLGFEWRRLERVEVELGGVVLARRSIPDLLEQ
jgi:hypothetical protein